MQNTVNLPSEEHTKNYYVPQALESIIIYLALFWMMNLNTIFSLMNLVAMYVGVYVIVIVKIDR